MLIETPPKGFFYSLKQGCTDACIPAFVLENHFFSINSLKIGSERSTTAVSTQ